MNDTAGRIIRTLVQLIAGGALTAIFEQAAKDVPPTYTPYVLLFSVLLVTVCQNVAEERGWVKPFLKSEPAKP